MIATDLDGTLKSFDRPLSECTRAALNSLVERGCHVVVATGRSLDFIRIHCPGVNLVDPQITANGAAIVDPLTEQTLSLSLVPAGCVAGAMDFLLHADIPPIVVTSDHTYMDKRITDPEDWVAPGRSGSFLPDMRSVPAEGIIKIVGESNEDSITRVRPLAAAAFDGSLYVTQTSHRLIEFLNPAASKGAALRRIAEWLDISRDEIIAFGDNHNDLSMFAVAGLSVAMGNASDEVKRGADRVTLTSGEDGVVAALAGLQMVEVCTATDEGPDVV